MFLANLNSLKNINIFDSIKKKLLFLQTFLIIKLNKSYIGN